MIYLNKIIQKEDLQKYIDSNCVVHVISKYGKQDYANYVNLTKLLKDSIIVVTCDSDDTDLAQLENPIDSTTVQAQEVPKSKERSNSNRKHIDRGKILALYNAGWSGPKIADEMNCSTGTVYNVIKMHNRAK